MINSAVRCPDCYSALALERPLSVFAAKGASYLAEVGGSPGSSFTMQTNMASPTGRRLDCRCMNGGTWSVIRVCISITKAPNRSESALAGRDRHQATFCALEVRQPA